MLEAAFWGLVAASALVIGAAVGIWVPISRRIVALVMAFGSGALVSALAFDLTEEAFNQGGTGPTALGLALGGLTFFVGDLLIERGLGGSAGNEANNGPAIVLGALLDGLPESIVLGASLIGGLGVSVSFLAAVFASNFPEGLGAARDLRDAGRSPGQILLLWVVIALASSVAAAIGFVALGDMAPGPAALIQAFAAGAILAMLADTMFPEAFRDGGIGVALATVFGFSIAFFLSAALERAADAPYHRRMTAVQPKSGPRTVRAPRGTELSCKGWQQEAALRMLMNNLDPDVAEDPDNLVVYGGTGRAARSWEAFDAIVAELQRLENDETLLIQSGKPVGVFRTTP